ncbi:hypothetical protein HNY73_020088 [Argiope bruennichi]|uniref:Uncharacterized protein n=1 Tax=Argiope bruennichi TaxID=94029 RepID=A0A8T0E9G5_ARGBR|nr:hypothetical protein HNY73_020088 [Argiope bruennichi]
MFQTHSLNENASKGNKIHYKSSKYPRHTISELPMLQNRNYKRNMEKQVAASSTTHLETSTDSKISASQIPHNRNFKRGSKKLVKEGNIIHYGTGTKVGNIHLTESPMLPNGNFKRNTRKHATGSSKIHNHQINTKNIVTTNLSVLQADSSVRIKRETEKDGVFNYDADKVPKVEKGIKILEQEPGETQCNYNQCVEICKAIYFAIPIHLAQCYNNGCFSASQRRIYIHRLLRIL